jgi:hypothetical protein
MKNREQGSGTRDQDVDRMTQLLRDAMPQIGDEAGLDRDLWPGMLRRVEQESLRGVVKVPWFDWALAGGLVAFAALAPRTIPVILYYL